MCVCHGVCVCVCVHVRACVHACVCVCVSVSMYKREDGMEGQREGERKPLEEGWTISAVHVMKHMHFPRQLLGLHNL